MNKDLHMIPKSRAKMEREVIPDKYAVISITEPGMRPPAFSQKILEKNIPILFLFFHDADAVNVTLPEGHPLVIDKDIERFSDEQAEKVLNFVKYCGESGYEGIIVHCFAGFCRSPAICACVTKLLGGDDSEYFIKYSPNMYVFRKLMEINQQKKIL